MPGTGWDTGMQTQLLDKGPEQVCGPSMHCQAFLGSGHSVISFRGVPSGSRIPRSQGLGVYLFPHVQRCPKPVRQPHHRGSPAPSASSEGRASSVAPAPMSDSGLQTSGPQSFCLCCPWVMLATTRDGEKRTVFKRVHLDHFFTLRQD